MAEKKEKTNKSKPKYKELCNGESVELDENNKHVSAWLNNNIIIKEI